MCPPNPHPYQLGSRSGPIGSGGSPPDRPRGLQRHLSKLDCDTGTVTRHDFGTHGYPGEPYFIAAPNGAEDEGVVVALVFDAERKRTDVVGLDARDVAGKPLFVGRLKHQVPFMLHGTFRPLNSSPTR